VSTASRRVLRAVAFALATIAAVGGGAATAEASPSDVGTQYYPISGVGSTWSANALQQWSRNVWSNYKWKVTYSDQGSSAGRQLFSQPNGGYDFAVSEIPYALKNSDSVDPVPARKFAYMPIVAGGTSFMYNLVIAGKRVTNLRLGGDTVSKIFAGDITKWNDPAIASDNPGLTLPAIPIVPVVRSDGSGTSAQLSSWMRSQFPDIWNHLCQRAGRPTNCGITSNYPALNGFKAQSGSNGVAGYVSQSQYVGSITYVEYSYALNDHFPVAKILNSAGYYTEPTAANVAVALLKAQINQDESSTDYLTQILNGVYTNPDPRTYPLSSYSYMLIPTALEYGFTENKGLTLAAFADYFLCEGQQQAEVLGYSPLPINLAQAGLDQVLKIPGGDPKDVNINKCNNPTFTADGSNKLANEAPQPQACDKKGTTQCTTGTGGAANVSTANSASNSTKTAASGTGTGSAGTATGSNGPEAATKSDGSVADAASDSRPLTVTGMPNTLAVSSVITWPGIVIAVAAALAVLLAIFLPPLVGMLTSRGPPAAPRTRPRTVIPRIHLRSRRTQRAPGSSRNGAS
jgi:phosphate ABC transporter phosphate-binding protein